MKRLLTLLLGLSFAAAAWSQTVPVDELVGPNNRFRDPLYGISLTFPAGWEVREALRWGKDNRENTITFRVIWPLESSASLYYQPSANVDRPAPGQEEAYFRAAAAAKAESRMRTGLRDYRNIESSFRFAETDGRLACSYVATFTSGGKRYFEHFIRVIGSQMMVMFFTKGPLEELEPVSREIHQMASTVRLP